MRGYFIIFIIFVNKLKHSQLMINLKIDISKTLDFIDKSEIEALENDLQKKQNELLHKTGAGNDFLGWVDLPSSINPELINRINADAKMLREKSEVLVVIGIGGSYLGARAVIDALANPFVSLLPGKNLQVIYAGNSLSADYHSQLLELLNHKDYSILVISKSGTTTEPAIAFRLLKNHIEKKYGKAEACSRIIAVTDKSRGALKTLADKEGYSSYVIPDDVGGRYSVLTPVGLIPIAAAGFNIQQLVNGAAKMEQYLKTHHTLLENPAFMYAAVRNLLYYKGKETEILVNFEPCLFYITEWWKQLYGESEGKEGKGIFPAGVNFTTDLHSMGQYIQDGKRFLFETVISVEKSRQMLEIPMDSENADGLNFLAGKDMHEVNATAEAGTSIAHIDGEVPNIRISLAEINEENLGELIYFFEFACGLSGYLLGVNPFDQPGVEDYKNNMFALLRKPGYEKQSEEIYKRISE